MLPTLYMSDSHPEAENGFGLHTEQVDQQHKIEAFKASRTRATSSWLRCQKLTGTVVLRSSNHL